MLHFERAAKSPVDHRRMPRDRVVIWPFAARDTGAQCAACGSVERVHAQARCGCVPFCEDCLERACTPTPYGELGAGG